MADFVTGVYQGTITAQYFRQLPTGQDVFSLDFNVKGMEDKASGNLESSDVAYGTVDLFLNEEQLGPPKTPEPGKKAYPNTAQILKHLGCEGYDLENLEPGARNHKSLTGVDIRLWGKPQKKNPQYGQYSILIDTPRGPRESLKGAGRRLDNMFKGCLGRKKVTPVVAKAENPSTPAGQPADETVESQAVSASEGSEPDELPF